MYTIGQVAEMFGVPVSTLRYYDKEGLFPEMRRVSGIRQFSEKEIEALRVIECLKKSGLEIRDIKQFMQWCTQGSKTYAQRRELFEKQRGQVESEIQRLGRVLDMLKFKCWYYLFHDSVLTKWRGIVVEIFFDPFDNPIFDMDNFVSLVGNTAFMSYDDDGHSHSVQVFQYLHYFYRCFAVQSTRRFVGKDYLWFGD